MSMGEMLYLALVLFAFTAFAGTLSVLTYGGKPKPETQLRREHGKRIEAGAH